MKKLLALLLILTLGIALVACGEKPATPDPAAETINLKVWGSQEDQEMLATMIEDFKLNNPDKTYNIELGVVSEADAKARYLEDPAAAADVFAFPNDQLKDLVSAGALYELSGQWKTDAISQSIDSAVDAATLDGKLYAFPMTADNGYFLYYDKSVLTEEDVKSLDTMLAKAGEAGKSIFMDVSNGWYIASFFLGAGGTLGIDVAGKQTCDFNNEKGVAAGEAIKAFTADPAFMTGDDSILKGGIGTTIAAGVSGTWNAADISGILGDNYAATKLPTFTVAGEQVQMSSFAGFKLIGVNKLTAHAEDAMNLAAWLTNEANQITRFTVRSLGPANANAAKDPTVLADPALAALAMQSVFAVSQNDVLGNYWTPAEAFGAAMEAKDYSKDIQTMLDEMVAQIIA